ncbi:MAG TPA: hypothetical protein VFR08_11320 [Candidatus Angelobacter sp.]|jgi:hypothetical protein|nr:hypothetical protein [Candidatus Angelobacter sp.]HKS73523.1 hypothetical protein [Terriglobales bacterium]
MHKPFPVLLVFCLAATLALAQGPPQAARVCEIHTNKPKPGMTQQYEQARIKHMAWHKSQNDAWSWAVWQVLTGEHTGDYIVGTCDHDWKDFDAREKFNAADAANANATTIPFLAEETMAYYELRGDLTTPPSPGPPPPYLTVLHFLLKPDGVPDFTESVKKVTAGMAKTNYPQARRTWYALVNGGRGPEFVLVTERKGVGDLAPPAKTLDAMMQEAYGDQGAVILASLRKAVYSTYSELLQFRADLSYMPATAPKP